MSGTTILGWRCEVCGVQWDKEPRQGSGRPCPLPGCRGWIGRTWRWADEKRTTMICKNCSCEWENKDSVEVCADGDPLVIIWDGENLAQCPHCPDELL